MTFSNRQDYISFRHHTYAQPKGASSIELTEVGALACVFVCWWAQRVGRRCGGEGGEDEVRRERAQQEGHCQPVMPAEFVSACTGAASGCITTTIICNFVTGPPAAPDATAAACSLSLFLCAAAVRPAL